MVSMSCLPWCFCVSVLGFTGHRKPPAITELPHPQYKDTNGIIGSTNATTVDYDPSILIVSQQAIWPKSEAMTISGYNSTTVGPHYHHSKDHLSNNLDSTTSSIPSSHQYYNKNLHRTLASKEIPSTTTSSSNSSHLHCSIMGSQQPTAKNASSYSSLNQAGDNARTSASNNRDDSPMVVVQVTDG